MKITTTFLTILICSILFVGCSKTSDEVVPADVKVARLLTGLGNRYWHLKEVYVNNVPQTLSDPQKAYTKTYTVNASKPTTGIYIDSDNQTGTFNVTDANHIEEVFVTGGGVGLIVTNTINEITETKLDVIFSANGKLERQVYYAY